MSQLRIINANISTPRGHESRRGADMADITHIQDGAIVIDDGIISYVGPMSGLPETALPYEEIDAGGNAVLPGFVDSHTHLIFGGYRPDEFEWRLKGDSYMSIMERGGGIQSTVNATRAESVDSLVGKAQWFIDRMSEMGVTTVEAKSGYGLETATELKIPREYKGRTSDYVDLMIREMMPAVKGKARFFDIFTEKNVFEIEDSRKLLNAAKEMGFDLKLHADEIVTLGGAELAAEVGAVSADHLLHVSEEGIRRMAEKNVVATLLPLTAFALREPYARSESGFMFLRIHTAHHRSCMYLYGYVD